MLLCRILWMFHNLSFSIALVENAFHLKSLQLQRFLNAKQQIYCQIFVSPHSIANPPCFFLLGPLFHTICFIPFLHFSHHCDLPFPLRPCLQDPTNLQYRPRGEGGGPGGRAPVGKAAGEVKGATIDWVSIPQTHLSLSLRMWKIVQSFLISSNKRVYQVQCLIPIFHASMAFHKIW
jgi:hypothetical protein